VTQAIAIAVAAALVLGALVAAALLPFRRHGLARRALFAAWMAIAAWCAAEVLTAVAAGPAPARLASPEALRAFAQAARTVRDVLVVNALLQLFDFVGWDLVLGRMGGGRAVSRLVVNLVNVAILLLATLGILNAHYPARLNGILVTSTVVSAIVGLALQEMLANVAAGIALQIEGSVAPGEWVRVGESEGEVVQLSWRTLTLRTRDGDLVTLPNGNVARGEVVNYDRPSRVHVDAVDLPVGYPHVPAAVEALLAEAALETPGVEPEPSPRVQLLEYGDSAMIYRVRFGTRDHRRIPDTRGRLRTRALYALRRAGLDIPVSNLEVRLERASDEQAERARANAEAGRAAALRPVGLLAPLSDVEIQALASRAAEVRYADGERIVRQGEAGETLFVLRSGRARVAVDRGGVSVDVAERVAGDAFGEMSLFADTPRSATVTAIGDVEALVLDRAAFRELLLGNPNVAEGLARVVAERAAETEMRTGEVAIDPPERRPHQWLLERLRALFGLPQRP